ncbi:MAG: hypothetical protein NC191_02725 [Muribaculaceae bacterium]|nr:hypothetical protein [Muribaculaceae bacterium]
MINSIGNNFVNRVNSAPVQSSAPMLVSNPYTNFTGASQTDSSNLITQYLENLGRMNAVNINKKNEIVTPSGVDGYNNYVEVDNNGNKVVDVSYTKEGGSVVQNVKVKSPSGTTTERIAKNSDNEKSFNLTIKDKDGNVLLSREKSTKKIDTDKTQTVVNGDVYNVSGLSSNIIKVEHNGETVILDLDKMLNEDVVTSKGENDSDVLRDTKITPAEKAALFDKIKALDGDDLFRMSKSTQKIQYYAGQDSFFCANNKTLQIQIDDAWNQGITVHELGHGYNHKNEVSEDISSLLSSNENLSNIRAQAANYYLSNPNPKNGNDERCFGKFLDLKKEMSFFDGNEKLAASNLQDEIFAESYNLLNTTEITDFSDGMGCPGRMLSMMKYLPNALVEVESMI